MDTRLQCITKQWLFQSIFVIVQWEITIFSIAVIFILFIYICSELNCRQTPIIIVSFHSGESVIDLVSMFIQLNNCHLFINKECLNIIDSTKLNQASKSGGWSKPALGRLLAEF